MFGMISQDEFEAYQDHMEQRHRRLVLALLHPSQHASMQSVWDHIDEIVADAKGIQVIKVPVKLPTWEAR